MGLAWALLSVLISGANQWVRGSFLLSKIAVSVTIYRGDRDYIGGGGVTWGHDSPLRSKAPQLKKMHKWTKTPTSGEGRRYPVSWPIYCLLADWPPITSSFFKTVTGWGPHLGWRCDSWGNTLSLLFFLRLALFETFFSLYFIKWRTSIIPMYDSIVCLHTKGNLKVLTDHSNWEARVDSFDP